MQTLLFPLAGFEVQHIAADDTTFTITAQALKPAASCPCCQQMSRRVYSYYTRSPHDLPISGQRVRLILRVRRFRCPNPQCSQQTFVERIPEVVPVQGRRTTRLGIILDGLASVLGGQAGEHFAKQLGIAISADTLLRRAKQAITPPVTAPRILGVDDAGIAAGSNLWDHPGGSHDSSAC